jgi:hypothetical protein
MIKKIMPGDGSMGFSLPPEGESTYEFTGVIERCGADQDCLRIEAEYEDDPSAKINVFCKLSSESGLRKLTDVLHYSNVWEKLRKKKPGIGNIEDGVDENMLTDDNFHKQLKIDLAGCRIKAVVKHSKGKFKDKNGDEVERTNANVDKIMFAMNESKPVAAATPKGTDATEENSGW